MPLHFVKTHQWDEKQRGIIPGLPMDESIDVSVMIFTPEDLTLSEIVSLQKIYNEARDADSLARDFITRGRLRRKIRSLACRWLEIDTDVDDLRKKLGPSNVVFRVAHHVNGVSVYLTPLDKHPRHMKRHLGSGGYVRAHRKWDEISLHLTHAQWRDLRTAINWPEHACHQYVSEEIANILRAPYLRGDERILDLVAKMTGSQDAEDPDLKVGRP